MFHKVCTNDIALSVSLLYLCSEVVTEWAQFSTCSKPIHTWFVVSCLLAVSFRATRLATSYMKPTSDYVTSADASGILGELLLFDIRGKSPRSRRVVNLTWSVVMPFFAVWGLVGLSWLWDVMHETPQCMPDESFTWFSCLWVFLCNAWSIVHVCLGYRLWCATSKIRLLETNVRAVEDIESLRRWGSVNISDTIITAQQKGLDPAQIKTLPCEIASGILEMQLECSICLSQVCDGECTRRLPKCGHTFHRCCIDLWLVRNAECPLCKQHVLS